VYVVGAVPLVIVMVARRGLRESARFEQSQKEHTAERSSLLATLQGPYRSRVFIVALCWAFTYVCGQCAVTYWKQFATLERGFTDKQVGGALTIAALGSLPLLFFIGKFFDRFGRRAGAIVVYVVFCASVYASYSLHSHAGLTIALVFSIFGSSAVLPLLNNFTTELFPTEMRSDAYAWCNNFLGRIGYVVAPIAVGIAAETYHWGPSVAFTAMFPMVALAIILAKLPETRGRELEETAQL
jgi:MFS transporter, putative metabolite:H+ symporter